MSSDPIQQHVQDSLDRARHQSKDSEITGSAANFFKRSHQLQYSYNFSWLTRPIIQYPQDIVAFQEIVSSVKPDLIIETGIAHGGSLVLSASLLCLLDVMDGLDPRKSPRKVVGVDIDIRPHNRKALDEHRLRFKMELIEGSSIDPVIIKHVRGRSVGSERILVSLDSNHTHEHVLAELNAYADLVSAGSYCIVFDTVIEDLPPGSFPDRPWDVGNNPKTAVHEWLKSHPEFEIDKEIDNKLLISVAPDGYLKRKTLKSV
ncbi:MAG: cephalosporin hydroxylase family protein [Synechococcaceae cyanobacterium ELA445]